MSDERLIDWDPRDQSVLNDQRAAYDRMREQCPVARSEFLDWSVFRHDDVVRILDDPVTFSSHSRHLAIPNGMDPPEHTQYRALIEPFFTTAAIAQSEPACRSIASELIDPLVGRRDVDVIGALAVRFSLQAICVFLGWPVEQWEHLRGWTHGNQQASFARDRDASVALAREFTAIVQEELARRRRDDRVGDDLTSRLMTAEVDGRPLSDEAIISILRNWVAGHGTVAAGLGLLLWHLARDEQLQQELRDSPVRLPHAIDEILRSDGPLVSNRRTTSRAVTIAGRSIPAGERLTLMWIAADRDSRVFTRPDEIDLDRDLGKNLLFGWGIHDCVGAPLARMEMRVVLEELLSRTAWFAIADAEPVERMVYPSNGISMMALSIR